MINGSVEAESNDAYQCEVIRRKDNEKVIRSKRKIPIINKTKSLLLGYPLPPAYNGKETQEKLSEHSDTWHDISSSSLILGTKIYEH